MTSASPTNVAMRLTAFGRPLSKVELPIPEPSQGSVVTRVLAAPLASYMHLILDGKLPQHHLDLPVVPNPPSIARVYAVGPGAVRLKPGDLVFINSMIQARDHSLTKIVQGHIGGESPAAKSLWSEWKEGAFQQYQKVPLENCLLLDENRLCKEFGYTPAILQSITSYSIAAGAIIEAAKLRSAETIVIGPSGGLFSGLAVELALAVGGNVIALGRNEEKLATMKRKLNNERLQRRTEPGRMPTTTGRRKGTGAPCICQPGPRVVKFGGRIVLSGGTTQGLTGIGYVQVVARDLQIIGKWVCSRQTLEQLLQMITQGLIKIGAEGGTVVREFDLDSVEAAVEYARKYVAWRHYAVSAQARRRSEQVALLAKSGELNAMNYGQRVIDARIPGENATAPRLGRLALKETRAKEFFYHETVPQLSGCFGRPFWNIVLQFTLTEASIRHASVALATLHEEYCSAGAQTSQEDSLKTALQSYNRAINMVLRAASEPASISLVAVASIVFTCFECLLGDPMSAAAHVRSGIGLLKMLREKSGQPSGPWGQHYQNFESAFIETHISPILCTLNLCVAEFGYPAEVYLNAVDANGCPVFDQPFRELLEARVGIVDITTAAMRVSQDGPSSSQLRKAANLRAALCRWKMRFDDLVLRQEPLWGPQDRSGASLIRVMWQATEIGLSIGPAADETTWDAHKAAYEVIIQLVESLIKDSQGSQRFHFEMGLISPLHLVAWKCRWPSLRRKGLALLHASSRRECLYDARLYYAVFSRIMTIEESYLNQHQNEQSGQHNLPPEQARIHHFVCESLSSGADGVYLLKLFSRPNWPEPEWRLHTEHLYLNSLLACQDGDSFRSTPLMARLPVVNLFRTGPIPTMAEIDGFRK
ncbi:hypothetical protein NM208_g4476 [Fusarium decemcellulare]|uniref:Uncharacterized protein n=1 Tax=Fusarium decemcellulare TaxID=57161 RepID=A0ACC1SKN3_9HYPO|nr:hypothetical protein NM208_g4476 [Fusarium decemcellulare]